MGITERFAGNLLRCRKQSWMSQEALAARASLHRTEIGKLEKAERLPKIDTLVKLAVRCRFRPNGCLTGSSGRRGTARRGASCSRQLALYSGLTRTNRNETKPNHQRKREIQPSIEQESPEAVSKGRQARGAGGWCSLKHSQSTNPAPRHTTNPPDPCLSRPFLIHNVSKPRGGGSGDICRAAGGRFWHGFAVRLAACKAAPQSALGWARPMHSSSFLDSRCGEMPDDRHSDFESLLSPEEVARACGLSRRAVYRAIRRGELRAARLCNRLRVQPAELGRWIDERTVSPARYPTVGDGRPVRVPSRGSLRAKLGEAMEGSEDSRER
jgi:excisionase family DNA binding protein